MEMKKVGVLLIVTVLIVAPICYWLGTKTNSKECTACKCGTLEDPNSAPTYCNDVLDSTFNGEVADESTTILLKKDSTYKIESSVSGTTSGTYEIKEGTITFKPEDNSKTQKVQISSECDVITWKGVNETYSLKVQY